MKRAMITVKQGDITLKVPADTVATTFISAALAQVGASQQVAANHDAIPALGEYWPGEGGRNGGLVRGRDGTPDYHLIVPDGPDAEFRAAYGGYGHETEAAGSPWDGLANTRALLADSEEHPAARLAADFTRDGHRDYYLPARRELQLAEANVPELFSKGYHWSSTQCSAYDAFYVGFEGGWQLCNGKDITRLVRPVRRKII